MIVVVFFSSTKTIEVYADRSLRVFEKLSIAKVQQDSRRLL